MFRDYLGCGTPPAGYDAAEVVERLGRTDAARVEAGERYRFGDAGFVLKSYGVLFPWCPRWFAENGNGHGAACVELTVRNKRHGLPAARGLTAEGETLVCAHEDHLDRLEADRVQRDAPKGDS